MSQLLALEWNGHEARVAVASRHGDSIVIEQAFAVPLPAPQGEGPADPTASPSIAAALQERGIGQLDALVAVGRGSVELRQLQLPPTADDELAGMVQLRATLEFNELDEKWLLDFVPIDEAGKGNRNVLAAAIAPEVLERIQAVCQPNGLRLQHVVLRSCAAASFLTRAGVERAGRVPLLVELFTDQAELTAVAEGRVLLPRMVRLSGEVSEPAAFQGLATEIRLTIAAVQNQFGGRRVTGIVLCGRGETAAAVARQIEEAVGLPATVLDPFAGLELGAGLRKAPPEAPGRFAAVLGMLLAEFERTGHAIDFLRPRRPAVKSRRRNKWALAAAAVVLAVLGYFVHGRIEYGRLAAEVDRLDHRLAAADKVLNTAGNRNLAMAGEIARWTDGDVVWLDRLRELSEDFPSADVGMIGHLLASCQSERSSSARLDAPGAIEVLARMHLEGRARDTKALAMIEHSLSTHARRLEHNKTSEDRTVQPYTLTFRAIVQVGRKAKP